MLEVESDSEVPGEQLYRSVTLFMSTA